MEDKKVLERFSALLELVNEVHDQCKKDHDVNDLIDVFAKHNSLVLAFREDCEMYLIDKTPSDQLSVILQDINGALTCSSTYILRSARQLQTPIIGYFIQQMIGPRPFPN